jgi:hypothetical protein
LHTHLYLSCTAITKKSFKGFLFLCLSVFLSFCHSVSFSICLTISLSICLSISFSLSLTISLSICPSISFSLSLTISLSICLSDSFSLYLTISLSICLSIVILTTITKKSFKGLFNISNWNLFLVIPSLKLKTYYILNYSGNCLIWQREIDNINQMITITKILHLFIYITVLVVICNMVHLGQFDYTVGPA